MSNHALIPKKHFMTDISFTKWPSMNDKSLAEHVGAFIKHHRMAQDKTQDELATAAGISRSTLSLLERGETVTVATLIQVLRVLDQLQVMQAFAVEESISPLALVKLQKEKMQRASGKKDPPAGRAGNKSEQSDW